MTEQEKTVILEAREILARYFNQNPLLTSWQAVLDYCAIAVRGEVVDCRLELTHLGR